MKEAGLDDFEVSAWFGVYAPPKMPAPLQQKIHGAISGIINAPAVKGEPDRTGHRSGQRHAGRSARADKVRDGALVEGGRTGGCEATAVEALLDNRASLLCCSLPARTGFDAVYPIAGHCLVEREFQLDFGDTLAPGESLDKVRIRAIFEQARK